MTARVKKIVIEIGKREVSMTPAEARALRDALDDVLGGARITVTPSVPAPYPVPYPVPYERPARRWWEPVWTCDTFPRADQTVCISATQDNTARFIGAGSGG